MWSERTVVPAKKRILLSSRILSVPALLTCAIIWQSSASAETDQLDPTLILLNQAQVENIQKEEKPAAQESTITDPETESNVSEPSTILPQGFLSDVKSLFSPHGEAQNRSRVTQTLPRQEDEQPVQQAPDQLQEVPQTQYVTFVESRSTPKDKLLKTSISPLDADPDNPNKQTLNRLIEQISAMKMRPKPKESEPQPESESKKSISDVNETKPAKTELAQEQENRQKSAQTLNPEIVQRLEQIIEKSGKTNEPQLLADMLYQTGHYELAVYFYELAISRNIEAGADDADNSWLMMQKAVCLDKSDPQQAVQIYNSLISQYPASPWMELAKNRQGLINWLVVQQPEKLIEQCRQDLRTN